MFLASISSLAASAQELSLSAKIGLTAVTLGLTALFIRSRSRAASAPTASSTIIPRRMTARVPGSGEFVVFLIGMRINRFWNFGPWLRVARAMPKMIEELNSKPEEFGFLGAESYFGQTTVMIQYWRSREHLMSYSRNRNAEHLPAWKEFQQLVGTSGEVGIWHETYVIQNGGYENIYVNMPPFGLGKAVGLTEIGPNTNSANKRLQANSGEPSTETNDSEPLQE